MAPENPFPAQTRPHEHQRFEDDQAFQERDVSDIRNEFESARRADAGLHPQTDNPVGAGPTQILEREGDSTSQRAAPTRGADLAAGFREELAGKADNVVEGGPSATSPAADAVAVSEGERDFTTPGHARVAGPTGTAAASPEQPDHANVGGGAAPFGVPEQPVEPSPPPAEPEGLPTEPAPEPEGDHGAS